MTATQAAKLISEMPASQVPEWLKGMALAFENKALAEKTLEKFVEACEKKGNAQGNGPRQAQLAEGPVDGPVWPRE